MWQAMLRGALLLVVATSLAIAGGLWYRKQRGLDLAAKPFSVAQLHAGAPGEAAGQQLRLQKSISAPATDRPSAGQQRLETAQAQRQAPGPRSFARSAAQASACRSWPLRRIAWARPPQLPPGQAGPLALTDALISQAFAAEEAFVPPGQAEKACEAERAVKALASR